MLNKEVTRLKALPGMRLHDLRQNNYLSVCRGNDVPAPLPRGSWTVRSFPENGSAQKALDTIAVALTKQQNVGLTPEQTRILRIVHDAASRAVQALAALDALQDELDIHSTEAEDTMMAAAQRFAREITGHLEQPVND